MSNTFPPKAKRFEGFTEQERAVMSCAFYIAIEQWHRDAESEPDLADTFNKQVKQAEGFRTEIGY